LLSAGAIASTSATDALYQQNLNKIRSLSEMERNNLDQDLAIALDLYYQENFKAALPIFQRIAARVETMDLMFWIGTSAAKLGQYDLARTQFERMLALDPALYRVRLEYADVLYRTGSLRSAREELELVKRSSPPPQVARNIDRRLARINTPSTSRTRWAFNLSSGLQYDDNVTSGPNSDAIAIATGTLNLGTNQREKDGTLWLLQLRGNVLHDIGEPGEVILAGKMDIYSSQNSDYQDVNYLTADISSGPIWASGQYVFKAPVGFKHTQYGNQSLSDTLYLAPSVTYNVDEMMSWEATYKYANESYSQRIYAGNDNQIHSLAIGPNFYLSDRRHTVSAFLTYEERDADAITFSHQSFAFDVSYFTRINQDTDLFANYRYLQRNYDAPAPLFTSDREDDRHSLSAVVVYRFRENYFVSVGYTYIKNNSNAALYEFDKNMLTFEIGMAL